MTKLPEKVIETSAIRLTGDETRAVMKAASSSTPISDYRCCGLVDLGIMQLVPVTPANHAAERKECWKKIARFAVEADKNGIQKEFSKLEEFARQESQKNKGYILTPLGKQVARGVNIRMNSQFKAVPC